MQPNLKTNQHAPEIEPLEKLRHKRAPVAAHDADRVAGLPNHRSDIKVDSHDPVGRPSARGEARRVRDRRKIRCILPRSSGVVVSKTHEGEQVKL